MIAKIDLLAAGLAGILVCSMAAAQARPGFAGARVSGMHVRPSARISAPAVRPVPRTAPTAPRFSVPQISPSGRATTGFSTLDNSFGFADDFGGYGIPGLGFDYPHLAAISSAFQNSNSGFRHHEHFGNGEFAPIWFWGGYGGYPYYYDENGYEQPAEQAQAPAQTQPQLIVIQQPVPAQGGGGESVGGSSNYANPSPAREAAAPVRDVGEFVLVKRNGSVLFASMYMVSGKQLTYVTPEGMRRTLPLSDLDAAATQQMNEARGTTVQLPN